MAPVTQVPPYGSGALPVPVSPLGKDGHLLLVGAGDVSIRWFRAAERGGTRAFVLIGSTRDRVLSVKEAKAVLLVVAADALGTRCSPERLVEMERDAAAIANTIPVVNLAVEPLSTSCDAGTAALADRADRAVAQWNDARPIGPTQRQALAELQAVAADIYGRLEPDRALLWLLEEVGELSQAFRRHEGASRLVEELGQVAVWSLCLANILEIDLADALDGAMATEVRRQLDKHGKLRPYGR